MDLTVRPATAARFDDVETMLGPKRRPDAVACWCLPYRLGFRESASLDAAVRREAVRALCRSRPPPGVLAYDGDDVVGWAAIARRADLMEFADTDAYPRVDDRDTWSIFCLRTRGGRRRQGIGRQLLAGAVDFVRAQNPEAIESYPLDTIEKIAPVFAYPGFRPMFESAGFEVVARGSATVNGVPRVVMRAVEP